MTPAVRNIVLGQAGPSLDLNFLSGALDSRITFTRSTTASYFDSAGVLQSAAINAPRFDYDPTTLAARGLLIEEARTNVWLNSADVSQASWAKTGITVAAPVVTANQVAAPDGALTAAKVVYPVVTTAGNASYLTYNSFNGTVAVYSFSVWLKGNVGGEQLWLGATPDAVTYYRQSVTLTTAWQRFTFITSALTAVNWFFTIGCDRRDASQTAIAAQTIFVWGAQLELGAFPTSYIPTTTVAVARGGDVASMSLGSWFNALTSTIVAEGMFPYAISNAQQGIVVIDDGTTNNRIVLRGIGGTSQLNAAYVVATVATANINAGAQTTGTPFKFGASITSNGLTISRDGAAVVSAVGASPTGLTTMRFGQNSVGAALMNGYIRRVRYWPRLLPDGQLLAATR